MACVISDGACGTCIDRVCSKGHILAVPTWATSLLPEEQKGIFCDISIYTQLAGCQKPDFSYPQPAISATSGEEGNQQVFANHGCFSHLSIG